MRLDVATTGVVLLLLGAPRAEASPSARLVYVRGAGAEACPPEADLRKAVAIRFGYDPFFQVAQQTVVAQIARDAKGYHGRVQIVGEDGTARGERELSTNGEDCGELTSALALAVSIALDALEEPTQPLPPAPPTQDPEPAPSADVAPPPTERPRDVRVAAPVAPTGAATELAGSVGPMISIGSAPNAVTGAGLAVALRRPRFSLRFDARGELPASKTMATGGRVSTNVALATGSICLRLGLAFACIGAGAGLLWTHTDEISRPAKDRGTLFVAMLRLGLEVAITQRLYLEPFIDGGAHLAPHVVKVDGQSAYETSPVWGSVGVHIGSKIP